MPWRLRTGHDQSRGIIDPAPLLARQSSGRKGKSRECRQYPPRIVDSLLQHNKYFSHYATKSRRHCIARSLQACAVLGLCQVESAKKEQEITVPA
jgi:hypothetical protein